MDLRERLLKFGLTEEGVADVIDIFQEYIRDFNKEWSPQQNSFVSYLCLYLEAEKDEEFIGKGKGGIKCHPKA